MRDGRPSDADLRCRLDESALREDARGLQGLLQRNTKRKIPAHYPNTANNLYAAFIERAIDLVDDSCFVGMITSQTYMYLGTFKKCRKNVLNALAPPEVLCDTGYGVLDGAKVITAVAVLRKQSRPDTSRPCVAFRMFQETEDEKEAVFVEALSSLSRGRLHSKVVSDLRLDVYAAPFFGLLLLGAALDLASCLACTHHSTETSPGVPEAPKIADAKVGLADRRQPAVRSPVLGSKPRTDCPVAR